jgi:hypothetical protein
VSGERDRKFVDVVIDIPAVRLKISWRSPVILVL